MVLNLVSCGIYVGGGNDGLRKVFAVDSCQTILTHSAVPTRAFEGAIKKRRSGSTLSPRLELGPKANPRSKAGESKG